MSKYIIEIPDDVQYVLLNGKTDHKYYTAVRPITELEELNSDYINEHFGDLQDDAYLEGLREGKKAFDLLDAERDSEYQRGLDDAWEAARKIVGYTDHGGLTVDALGEVFGTSSYSRIVRDNTAQEAIDKIKAYEEKQKADDEIKVGDVVKPCANVAYVKAPFVVTKVDDERVWGVGADGSWNHWNINEVIKTDKHFDIDKILEEMKS